MGLKEREEIDKDTSDMVSKPITKTNSLNSISIFKFLIIFAMIDCVFQISLGGFVRVSGSGLGCPDWPLCFGKIIPPMNYHTLIEWGHRTSGVILGLTISVITLLAWATQRSNVTLVALTTFNLILVITVGGIGGAVVLTELEPSLRTLHLFLAQMIILVLGFSLITLQVQSLESLSRNIKLDKYSITMGLAALTIIITLLSGSYAVWKEAGTVCSAWPFCTSESIFPKSSLGWIHMIHRGLSYISVVVGAVACYIVIKAKFNNTVSYISLVTLIVIVGQIILGALNPWTKFEVWVRVAHLGVASILWGLIATLFCIISIEKFRYKI